MRTTTTMAVQGGESLGQEHGGRACGIKILCAMAGCNVVAGKTGFCVAECEPQVIELLLRDMRPLRINPATLDAAWYRENTGGILSTEESVHLRRAVMAQHAAQMTPRGAKVRDVMQDFDAHTQAPGDRMRCAAFYAGLPRVDAEDLELGSKGSPWWAWGFAGAAFAVLLIVGVIVSKGRAW